MEFIDLNLARRMEMAEARACRGCAESFHQMHPDFPIAVEEIGGGYAVFAGVDSPVTQAIGVGLSGEVSDAELDHLQEFFSSRGAAAAIELCPLVDMSLYERFAKRRFHLLEVSDVLFRKLPMPDGSADATPSDVTVRSAVPEEAKLWSETVAGGAAVSTRGGVCGLFGASTLPAFRRRGVQTALMSARLAWATERGCDLAVSIAQPGSASHRNIERRGFRVAYSRTKLIRALP
jgi:GNAT superfamily N-acetyltransferase